MTKELCRELIELRKIIIMAEILIGLDKSIESGKLHLKTATKKIDEILQWEEDMKKISLTS